MSDWRHMLEDLKDIALSWDVPLERFNTFRLKGKVRCLAVPETVEALERLLDRLHRRAVPWVVLGRGSNVVIPSGTWERVLIVLDRCAGSLWWERADRDRIRVGAGAGLRLSRLLGVCARHGWSGLEGLVGIPATVGGAVVMNAGTPQGALADVLEEVRYLDVQGKRHRRRREDLKASYRDMGLPERCVVLEAVLTLKKDDPSCVQQRMRRTMKRRRAAQPLDLPSAGCIFKNPPDAPAGALIDRAGLKGYRIGGAQVSPVHANWIVNCGGATPEDVKALIGHVKATVRQRFGVDLEEEVRVLEP
ncbi:UDP-N-acetylmuramate dehydrogenase [Desulfacinum hydrothermale DSM 13146]|uniref:UDP-N-acetylenolpyruvoylglucosamine reductase n=1 Tax=Desulfacinum hydrothermale DSM 13146 TaxID=1121390 RepID=A0A1W1XAS8_9BACT|nr:UDP-N-acetylmuramate dehydrogenase [Desulfacinum hydrothermale]SMC20957.1 UDP-N-acetylmuramate dehydrogenase [Desulfacinum hydrothermale DSM 13146]